MASQRAVEATGKVTGASSGDSDGDIFFSEVVTVGDHARLQQWYG